MKQRLLSVLAIAALSIGPVMAQSWTAPVEPKNPTQQLMELATAPEVDGNYFVMNVGEGQFLTGANVWATQISLSSDATPYMELTVKDNDSGYENTYFLVRPNDANDKFYGDHGRENGYNPPAGRNKLFRAGDDGYVDYNNNGGSSPLWMFNLSENGYYYIQSSIDDGVFPNAADEYAGSTGAGKYVSFTKTIEDANIEWVFIPVASVPEDYTTLAAVYAEDMQKYNARLALYELLNEAAKYEGVDYKSASDVYNNPESSLGEINAATEALKPVVAKAVVLASIAESSEENPVDVTKYVLTNTSFDDGMNGWSITEGMGQNMQIQGTAYTNEEVDPAVTIKNFIEAWFPTSVGALKDGFICQTVTGLPEGRYRIEADVMAVWQGEALSEDPKGIYLFYNNGSFILHSETLSTGNGLPEHFTFDFDYDGAETMTIGLMAQSTNMNWMGMDNLKLSAIGEVQTPPSYYALRTSVANYQELYDNNEKAQASVTEAFRTAYETASELAGSNPEKEKAQEYVDAFQTLETTRTAYVASMKAYANLADLITRIEGDIERYKGDSNFDELVAQLEELKGTYEEKYDAGAYSIEEIENEIAAYGSIQPNYVNKIFQEAAAKVAAGEELENPIDITCLFSPLTFPNEVTKAKDLEDKYGWNFTATENFNDNDGLKFASHTAEGWSCIFDANTVVKDLPAGQYTIKVKSFYRPTTDEEKLAEYEAAGSPELAWFYVNNGAIDSKDAILNWDALLEYYPKTIEYDEEGNEVEVENRPNNQAAAHELFIADSEASALTALEVSAVLREGGDLTIGAKSLEGIATNSWVIWSDITLIYEGAIDASATRDELLAYLDLADEVEIEGIGMLTVKASDDLATAKTTGEEALEADEAAQSAAIVKLKEAIDYAKASIKLVDELSNSYNEYDAKIQEVQEYGYEFADTEYEALLDEIYAVLESDIQDNETVQDFLDRLVNGWYPYVFSCTALEDASEESPVDMRLVLNNPNFDDMVGGSKNDPEGWTSVYENKGGGAGREGVAEFWNASTFDINQTVPTLKDGYWRLSIAGLYRAGNAAAAVADEEGNFMNEAYLYIENIKKKIVEWSDTENGAIAIPTPVEGEEPYVLKGNQYTIKDVNIDAPNNQAQLLNFIAEGRYITSLIFAYGEDYEGLTGAVTLGLKKMEAAENDWCPFDYFSLEYLGTTAPTAIENVGTKNAAATIASIYSIDGRQQSKLSRGINIVRTSEGKVVKVLVK